MGTDSAPVRAELRYFPKLGKKKACKDTSLVSRISEAILLRSMVNYPYLYFDRKVPVCVAIPYRPLCFYSRLL